MASCTGVRACNWIFVFSTATLVLSVNGQLNLLLPKDDSKPPPNPFGEIDPPVPQARPTPPPLEIPANPNPNPNPVFPIAAAPPVAPVAPAAPTPFNPPTPPPLPTPPPIGAAPAPSASAKGDKVPKAQNLIQQSPQAPQKKNPFEKGSSNDNPVPEAVHENPKWTASDTGNWPRLSNGAHVSGSGTSGGSHGWPRVPRSYVLVPSLAEIIRMRRQNGAGAAAEAASKAAGAASQASGAAKQAAGTASEAAKSAGSVPSVPGAGSPPGAENIPGASNIPDASSLPQAPSAPAGGSPPTGSEGGPPSISTFPDTSGDIVMPPNGSPKPTTPRFMLTRHLDSIKSNPDALQDLKSWG